MIEILIREAGKLDLQAIQRLLSTYFLDMEGLEAKDFVLAEINGQIRGCTALIKSEFQGKKFLEIHSIAVHPNFRGKKIGTRLIKHLLTIIDESACELYVRTTAPHFFEKLNFVKIESFDKLLLWEDCKNCDHFEKCAQYAMRYSYNG